MNGNDALREALVKVLLEQDWQNQDAGAFADALLPVVLRYGRETTAAAAARLKAIPTYELSNDGEPLGVVVLADDVLDALTRDPT